jgi:hypothetical protein
MGQFLIETRLNTGETCQYYAGTIESACKLAQDLMHAVNAIVEVTVYEPCSMYLRSDGIFYLEQSEQNRVPQERNPIGV